MADHVRTGHRLPADGAVVFRALEVFGVHSHDDGMIDGSFRSPPCAPMKAATTRSCAVCYRSPVGGPTDPGTGYFDREEPAPMGVLCRDDTAEWR